MLKNTLSGKKTQKGNKVSLAIYPFMSKMGNICLLTTATKRSFEKNNENSIETVNTKAN
jgi:ribosomal protein L28